MCQQEVPGSRWSLKLCQVETSYVVSDTACFLFSGKAPLQKKYLGLRMLPLTLNLLQEMKRQDPDFPDVSSGVFVYEVIQGSAAARL